MTVSILCKAGKKNVLLMKNDNSRDGHVENTHGISKRVKKKRGPRPRIKTFFSCGFQKVVKDRQ